MEFLVVKKEVSMFQSFKPYLFQTCKEMVFFRSCCTSRNFFSHGQTHFQTLLDISGPKRPFWILQAMPIAGDMRVILRR